MENETQAQEDVHVEQKNYLHQVTPLSKYLAMALFIILPFVGGWIGYTYAPEKVVEVERKVIREVEVGKEVIIESAQDKIRLTSNSYLEGDTIYNSDGQVLFEGVDVDSFSGVPDFTNYRYRPLADGGYVPRWFEDDSYLYCVPGKGQSRTARLSKPIEIEFQPLSNPFDSSDLYSWQNTDTREFGYPYFINTETGQRFDIGCEDVSNWIEYENELFTLSHPEDCKIKDYTALYPDDYITGSTVYAIGVCDVINDSVGGVSVSTNSVEEIVAQKNQLVSTNPNQTLVSVFKTSIGKYTAQNIKIKNETTQSDYSTVLFNENGMTFVVNGIDSDNVRWDMEKILSTIEVK